jgi:NAD(P)-dependent dehydrogenase (short-subunit alcohol dehydrogenase family)
MTVPDTSETRDRPAAPAALPKFRLDGKVAVVTGVGSPQGMGRHIALALAEAGADVALVARTPERIEATAHEVEAFGRRALPLQGNITEAARMDEVVRTVRRELGGVDVFCNHGGTSRHCYRGPMLEIGDAEWDEMFRQVLTSVMYGTRAAARAMIDQGRGGSIVNTSSLASDFWRRGTNNTYGVAKAAVNHYTRCMATELGPHGIRVNALVLGTYENAVAEGWIPQSFHGYWLGETALGRYGRVDELASAALFLASDASSYISGALLRVDGGFPI